MTSELKCSAEGIPFTEVRQLPSEDCLSIRLKPEQGFGDFTFCFKDGTSATFKNAGSLQEFLDKLARHHELEKKFEIATKALKNMSVGNVPSLPDDETLANAMCNYARDTLKQIEHKE